jgi:ketosteroid isomerase-like protein
MQARGANKSRSARLATGDDLSIADDLIQGNISMPHVNHELARRFFAALSSGSIPDELLTADMTVWTTTSGTSAKVPYQAGIKMLASVFSGGISYTVDSLTAEDDRVAAEVRARGTLINGENYHNVYLYMLRIRNGRIASVAEHFNPDPIRQQLGPLLQAALSKT